MISKLYLRRKGDDPEARILEERLKSDGFCQLKKILIEKGFLLEGVSPGQISSLKPLFSNPVSEIISDQSVLDKKAGPIIETGYQRAVTDPELPSILRGACSLGVVNLVWARITHRYQFQGLDKKTADEIVSRYLFNPQVQVIMADGELWETLKPQGRAGPIEKIDLKELDKIGLSRLSDERRLFLNFDQMRTLQTISRRMNRPFTDAEIEMFAQTWSDHCFHTTWKSLGLLQALWDTSIQINHPLVLSAFEDNAGVMEFYEGWALTIKGETHNSPTAVSPYGGIMTKHGGVIRDTLGCGQGAWPIGGSTVMGLGNASMSWSAVPKGVLHPKTILIEAIRGTADYCNPMGIPMMFPVYRFHSDYTGKCFALGHSIGIIPTQRAAKGEPKPGDVALLIGGPTGRDGLHGATVSSSSMTSQTSTVDAAHVQIGHPIQERKFMEAIPVLRDHDCIRAITDLGAAGLSSAAGEMGCKTGIWINLAWVPLKTEGMRPWEIWISESQERMLISVPVEKIDEAFSILHRFEVPAAFVGLFTDTKRCQVVFNPEIKPDNQTLISLPLTKDGDWVVDLDFDDLRKGCPLPKISIKKPDNDIPSIELPSIHSADGLESSIQAVLSHINVCDQSAAGTQFDSTIQGMTVTGPYGGKTGKMPNDIWASAPIRGKVFGATASLSINPFYGEVDPAGSAKLAIIESISKQIAAGVDLNDIVLCDNFYTPHITPEVAWTLKEMVNTCCKISRELKTPFISGKDSSSGTFIGEDGQRMDVPPTLCVLAMGRTADVRRLIPKFFQQTGNHLYLIGPLSNRLGGSIYLDTIGLRGDHLPSPSIGSFKRFLNTLRSIQNENRILSASAVGEGGLIRRIFEMALGSGLGCKIDLSVLMKKLKHSPPQVGLFAEMIGALVVEVTDKNRSAVEKELRAIPIGTTTESFSIHLAVEDKKMDLSMESLIESWKKPFQEVAQ